MGYEYRIVTARDRCLEILKFSESLHDGDLSLIGYQPKMDPAGNWTEAWGHLMIDPKTGKALKGKENEAYARKIAFINDPNIDDDIEAERLLDIDFAKTERQLKSLNLKLNDNQFYACADFVFNLGIGSFIKSTLYQYIKTNPKDARISQAFMMWIKSGDDYLVGLAIRRLKEATLYFQT
jgi:GH24 family phage-related lysozyme (muramidase)